MYYATSHKDLPLNEVRIRYAIHAFIRLFSSFVFRCYEDATVPIREHPYTLFRNDEAINRGEFGDLI